MGPMDGSMMGGGANMSQMMPNQGMVGGFGGNQMQGMNNMIPDQVENDEKHIVA